MLDQKSGHFPRNPQITNWLAASDLPSNRYWLAIHSINRHNSRKLLENDNPLLKTPKLDWKPIKKRMKKGGKGGGKKPQHPLSLLSTPHFPKLFSSLANLLNTIAPLSTTPSPLAVNILEISKSANFYSARELLKALKTWNTGKKK